MGTIANKLAKLKTTKAEIKAALEEAGQSVGDVFDTYPAAIRAVVSSGAKIATGSYVGTGKYGPDNPNSLTFDGNPQMVVVSIVSELGCAGAYPDYFDGWSEGNFMWVKGATYSGGYRGKIDILETEHGISWNTASNQDASKQCNESGKTYRYFAIVN